MLYQVSLLSVILSDHKGVFFVADLLKCDFSYVCTGVEHHCANGNDSFTGYYYNGLCGGKL